MDPASAALPQIFEESLLQLCCSSMYVKWDIKTDFYDILRHFGDHPDLLMSESRSDLSNNVVRWW